MRHFTRILSLTAFFPLMMASVVPCWSLRLPNQVPSRTNKPQTNPQSSLLAQQTQFTRFLNELSLMTKQLQTVNRLLVQSAHQQGRPTPVTMLLYSKPPFEAQETPQSGSIEAPAGDTRILQKNADNYVLIEVEPETTITGGWSIRLAVSVETFNDTTNPPTILAPEYPFVNPPYKWKLSPDFVKKGGFVWIRLPWKANSNRCEVTVTTLLLSGENIRYSLSNKWTLPK
jgi:hypothetical protein